MALKRNPSNRNVASDQWSKGKTSSSQRHNIRMLLRFANIFAGSQPQYQQESVLESRSESYLFTYLVVHKVDMTDVGK